MFFKKMQNEIEQLRWKVQSLEEKNKDLKQELHMAIDVLRRHVVQVKHQKPISDDSILQGLAYEQIQGKDVEDYRKRNPDTIVVDVRTEAEFNLGYMPGALHLPIDQFAFQVEELIPQKDRPVIAYCSSGSRSEIACEVLAEKGYTTIFNLAGGIGNYPDKLKMPESQKPQFETQDRELESGEKEIYNRVQKILVEEINPAVAAHGGVINLLDVRGKDVFVQMGGGCQGCGMAAMTLRQGVEESLRKAIPEMGSLYDVTDHAQGKNPYFNA